MQILDDLRVADVVREHASSRPDVVAIRCGPRALTYAELDDRSSRLAQALLSAGVRAGDRVAHLDRTAPEVVELLFATSKIGAVTVPLNWRLAPAELETIVADAGCTVMIAGTGLPRGRPRDRRSGSAAARRGRHRRGLRAAPGGHAPTDPGHRGAAERRRGADVHVGDHRPPEGRADDTAQPRRGVPERRGVAVRLRVDQPHAAADVPHRRDRLGVSRARERGDDDPRQRVRRAGGARSARARTGDERRVRPDDPADAGRRPGRGRARLLEPAFDHLWRVADHHPGSQSGAPNLPLPAVRRLRLDRDDRRRRSAPPRGPRRRRPAPAPAAVLGAPAALGRDADRRPRQRARLRRRRRRRSLAARAERDGRLLQPRRGDRRRADCQTGGCAPATAAIATRTATCSSPTGSRT